MTDTGNMQSQFDEVLREHIRRLLKTFPGAASLPFDLATITSLNLLVERDNEIEAFPESPTDRYTEDTLIEALTETGLDVDDHSRSAVQNLAQMGFVTINDEGKFIPRESTSHLVGVLDYLFPGFSGLKCPKASCGYRQNYIGRPLVNNQAGDSHLIPLTQENGKIAETPKRKKKIWVRKKFVRRKR